MLMSAGVNQDPAADMAQSIVNFRAGPDGVDATADDTPFQNMAQLAQADVPPALISRLAQICTVQSQDFEVHVTARIGDFHREYVAVLHCNSPTDIQILSFYWK